MTDTLNAAILRVLASRGRIDLIRTLRSYPDKEFTINELSRVSRIPTMTTWRAVKDLKKMGILDTRKIGNAVAVTLTDNRDKLRMLRLIPETDPQRTAALQYAGLVGEKSWIDHCRLFGSIGRGEHAPGEEIDIAVVYSERDASEQEVRSFAKSVADRIKAETNVDIVPLCVPLGDMGRKGGLASELRDKEVIWRRSS